MVVVMAILFEFDVLPMGFLNTDEKSDFLIAIILEITTICVIPMALRLFKFGKIHRALVKGKENALAKWGTLRLLLLCVPFVANALCYCLYENPAFAYMAIMLFICLFFVFPSMERCVSETTEMAESNKNEIPNNDITVE